MRPITKASLRRYRAELGLSQRGLAETLRLNTNTIAKWEQGASRISMPVVVGLALEALRVKKFTSEK